jgi:hypothetical protein
MANGLIVGLYINCRLQTIVRISIDEGFYCHDKNVTDFKSKQSYHHLFILDTQSNASVIYPQSNTYILLKVNILHLINHTNSNNKFNAIYQTTLILIRVSQPIFSS